MTAAASSRHVHVATGCIEDESGRILICRRPAHKSYPGQWEFPGGKVEAGESAEQALRRELHEELGITVTACRPLIRVRHAYPELKVELDTWKVTAFKGQVKSVEHPQLAWVAPPDLPAWKLLAADRPIIAALRLPPVYVFTPPALLEPATLDPRLALPPVLLRLRAPAVSSRAYLDWLRRHGALDPRAIAGLMVDRTPTHVGRTAASGFHATGAMLRRLRRRPVPKSSWFAASCHSAADVRRARRLGADFAVLGPVRPTSTHPGEKSLGWKAFAQLIQDAGMPVYAIGGLRPADLEVAWAHGAQGVAGISAYWGRCSSEGSGSSSSGMA